LLSQQVNILLLGGFYFYVDGSKMFLADKTNGELSPNLSVEFPSTTEISAEWTQKTQEVDDENIKGKELTGLSFDQKMKNAINYGKFIYGKNEAIVNFGMYDTCIILLSKIYVTNIRWYCCWYGIP